MTEINVPKQRGIYGFSEKESPNKLYKKYKRWHAEKNPGEECMAFSEWVEWAKDKGIVQAQMNADGTTAGAADKVRPMVPEKDLKKSTSGIILGAIVIGILSIAVVASLANKED